jgi:AcrR family transcriptional regulator
VPLPRYYKLSPEKRDKFIKTATEEFSNNHFQEASINRIIEKSGTSKGTIYYYFSDKADLYGEVLDRWTTRMLKHWRFDMSVEKPEEFWKEWEGLYRSAYQYFLDNPEAERMLRYSYMVLSSGTAPQEAINQVKKIRAYCLKILIHGKDIGAIRSDLPDTLIVRLFIGLYETFDRWVSDTYPQLSPDKIDEFADMITDLMKQLLASQG